MRRTGTHFVGLRSNTSGLWRFFDRHSISRKKGLRTLPNNNVRAAWEAWRDGQLDLYPDSLVFIDEIAAATNMMRSYGRSPRDERCRISMLHEHYKTTTVTAALRTSGLVATTLFDGATNSERFRAYVTDTLSQAEAWRHDHRIRLGSVPTLCG